MLNSPLTGDRSRCPLRSRCICCRVVTQRKALAFSREQVAAQAGATRDTQRRQARLRGSRERGCRDHRIRPEVARRAAFGAFPLLTSRASTGWPARAAQDRGAVAPAASRWRGTTGGRWRGRAASPRTAGGRSAAAGTGVRSGCATSRSAGRGRTAGGRLPTASADRSAADSRRQIGGRLSEPGGRWVPFATWLRRQYPQLGKQHTTTPTRICSNVFILRVRRDMTTPPHTAAEAGIYFQFDGPFFGYIVGITERPDAQGQAAALQDKGSMTTALQPPRRVSHTPMWIPGNYNIGQRVDTTPARHELGRSCYPSRGREHPVAVRCAGQFDRIF